MRPKYCVECGNVLAKSDIKKHYDGKKHDDGVTKWDIVMICDSCGKKLRVLITEEK